jgi:hypothetical protein
VPFPVSVATDSSNNVYVADQGSRRIRVVNRRTQVITTFAGGGRNDGFNNTGGAATAAQLDAFGYGITAMVFDSSQNMYLVDANRVRFVRRTTMTISTVAGAHNLCCLSGGTGNNGPATSATFIQLTGLALDSSNNVYTADVYDNTVRLVQRPSGTIVAYAGTTRTAGTTGDGGKATDALLRDPQALAIDRWVILCLQCVTTFSPSHSVVVLVTSSNNLYVATADFRVRVISAATGIITTYAGTTPGYNAGWGSDNGDGGLATGTSAGFSKLSGLAFDRSDNLYIADSGGKSAACFSAVSFSPSHITPQHCC